MMQENSMILNLRAALEYHVPSQPICIPSPRGLISRDSCLPLDTRTSFWVLQESFFESLLAD